MGKKYASIHIIAEEKDNILPIIIEYFKKDIFKERKIQALNMIKIEEVRRMVAKLPGFFVSNILIIQSKLFLSIYNESITFESIDDTARALSKAIREPLIYSSNFDDDVFIFGGYQSGKLISSRKLGEGLAVYDISPKKLNIDKFCNEFSICKKELIEYINSIEEIDSIENEIEKHLEIPLNLRLTDVQSDTKNYIEIMHEDNIIVYKKL